MSFFGSVRALITWENLLMNCCIISPGHNTCIHVCVFCVVSIISVFQLGFEKLSNLVGCLSWFFQLCQRKRLFRFGWMSEEEFNMFMMLPFAANSKLWGNGILFHAQGERNISDKVCLGMIYGYQIDTELRQTLFRSFRHSESQRSIYVSMFLIFNQLCRLLILIWNLGL